VLKEATLISKQKDGTLVPHLLHGESHRDGSFKADIPINALESSFQANFFIVSQVNPHIAPFFYDTRGRQGAPTRRSKRHGCWSLLKNSGMRGGTRELLQCLALACEPLHKTNHLNVLSVGFVLATLERLLKLDMRKWLELISDMDLLPSAWGVDFR